MLSRSEPCVHWRVSRGCVREGLAAAGLACITIGAIVGINIYWTHMQRADAASGQLLLTLDADLKPLRQERQFSAKCMHLGTRHRPQWKTDRLSWSCCRTLAHLSGTCIKSFTAAFALTVTCTAFMAFQQLHRPASRCMRRCCALAAAAAAMLLCVGIACAVLEVACSSGLVGMSQTLSATVHRATTVCAPLLPSLTYPQALACTLQISTHHIHCVVGRRYCGVKQV